MRYILGNISAAGGTKQTLPVPALDYGWGLDGGVLVCCTFKGLIIDYGEGEGGATYWWEGGSKVLPTQKGVFPNNTYMLWYLTQHYI